MVPIYDDGTTRDIYNNLQMGAINIQWTKNVLLVAHQIM